MKRTRRTYSREYKLAAVKKVIKQGLTYCEVARDLGIRDTLIHNWRKAFEADGTLQAEVNQSPPWQNWIPACAGMTTTLQEAKRFRVSSTVMRTLYGKSIPIRDRFQFLNELSKIDPLTAPYVEFNYADGSSNTLQALSMKYPNGRQIDYGYGTSGSLTDRTGRVATISKGEGAQTLVTYSYMGSGHLVSKFYNQPGIERTLASGSGSNPYAALDRFGRLIDLRWTGGY